MTTAGVLMCTPSAWSDDRRVAELEAQVERLTRELQEANAALDAARQAEESGRAEAAAEQAASNDIVLGPLTIGGAVRVNYVYGDYEVSGDAPQRGGNGGNAELDTFRVNVSLDYGQLIGKLEYRWYDGYNFLHTGWLGYDFKEQGELQVGVTRVPFGPGPYGVSQSWFFDQHYYVGLADDMDLGVKYLREWNNWRLAFAYFASSERDWKGASRDSARYG